MIRIDNINKSYGRLRVLNQVNLELKAGSSTTLLGPNASGKTTLLKCLLGLVVPDSGNIEVAGKKISESVLYRKEIGYMPQIGKYPENMKIGQLFDLLLKLRKDCTSLDEELISEFRLREQFEKPFRALSGGTIQKVSACIAFLFRPSVLILDEPTAGLDPISAGILKEKIIRERTNGKMFLVTSHILSELEEITQDLLYLFEGRVRFHKSIAEVKAETGAPTVEKALVTLMKAGGYDA